MLLSEEQWKALTDYIEAEAEYQASEITNRNDSRDFLRREAFKSDAKKLLTGTE